MSRSDATSFTFTPPRRTAPASTLQKRGTRLAAVVLPPPLGPTRAAVVPAGTVRLTSRRAGSLVSG